jgi:hypothetical protein
VIQADQRGGAKSSRIVPDSVGGVLASWLPDDLEGADVVRAAIAKRLAAELDRPDAPPYVIARLAGALVSVVSEIDGTREVARARPNRAELRQLLDDVR